ncbi:MAG TPA: hypothetical protein P5081_01065 [Phycisphaerae bacterium]|nr:hypothetical protein [Phycisphaerae bacterium]HRW51443.1 hypothetical protein [Phycisphaerae bacterium]
MARSARVQSTEAIRRFRAKLIEFADNAKAALGDTDAELLRAGSWLRQDREPYWKSEHRKRSEAFQRAKSALNQKRLYKSATGDRQSTVEEEKAFAIARRRLEEAEQKIDAIRAWTRKLEDERFLYKAQAQRMARAAEMDVPRAIALLDRVLDSLDAYFHERAPDTSSGVDEMFDSMARNLDAAQRAEAERISAERRAECAALRRLAPRPGQRDATPPTETAPAWPDDRRLSKGQLRAIAELNPEGRAAEGDDIVIVAKGAESAPRVFLERIRTSSPGDSGWYIGPVGVEAAGEDCVAIALAALHERRPDWASLLRMPFGSLIVENAAGLEYICDASDTPMRLVVEDEDVSDVSREGSQ